MNIYKKLFEAKKEIGKISKDSTNPFYKSKYFDINSLLEHIEPILQKHDLLLLQPIEQGVVKTVIIDYEEDKDNIIESYIDLPQITDPQKLGSAITYYRRYTLQSLLGLQAEDDDANMTVNKPQQETELSWLNQFESDRKTITRDWNRCIATLKDGKDMVFLRTKFKISKDNEKLLNAAAIISKIDD